MARASRMAAAMRIIEAEPSNSAPESTFDSVAQPSTVGPDGRRSFHLLGRYGAGRRRGDGRYPNCSASGASLRSRSGVADGGERPSSACCWAWYQVRQLRYVI